MKVDLYYEVVKLLVAAHTLATAQGNDEDADQSNSSGRYLSKGEGAKRGKIVTSSWSPDRTDIQYQGSFEQDEVDITED